MGVVIAAATVEVVEASTGIDVVVGIEVMVVTVEVVTTAGGTDGAALGAGSDVHDAAIKPIATRLGPSRLIRTR
jgi:hypothetical protein